MNIDVLSGVTEGLVVLPTENLWETCHDCDKMHLYARYAPEV